MARQADRAWSTSGPTEVLFVSAWASNFAHMQQRFTIADFSIEGTWTPQRSGLLRVWDADGTDLGSCPLNEDDEVGYRLPRGGKVSDSPIPVHSPPPVLVNNEVRFRPRGIPSFGFEASSR
jgi:hypothetical protein